MQGDYTSIIMAGENPFKVSANPCLCFRFMLFVDVNKMVKEEKNELYNNY